MFWIYVPPIILVVALASLAVMLGRKSADLKKIKPFRPQPDAPEEKGGSPRFGPPSREAGEAGWKKRLNFIGRKTLHVLEKILDLSKMAFKKTEQIFSIWAAKLRARRKGKKFEEIAPSDFPKEPDEASILEELEKNEDISASLTEKSENIGYVGSEVIVRRRIYEEPIVIPKKEPLPEDRVREAALIYRIAENPKDLEAYREIGDYYMGIGNIKDAKESFKMVLKLRPRDLKAKSSLREIEMKMRLGS
jgi:tetratricopeptide (TPR) repeat protein